MAKKPQTALALPLPIPEADKLPDNSQYTNRFEVRSQTSDSVYIIAQHKTGRWWSCSCFGWIRHRKCKHLGSMGLPGHNKPFELKFVATWNALIRRGLVALPGRFGQCYSITDAGLAVLAAMDGAS